MQQFLEEMSQRAENVDAAMGSFLAISGQVSADLELNTSSSGMSGASLLARVNAVTSGAMAIAQMSQDRLVLVPTSRLRAFSQTLDELNSGIAQLESQMQSLGGAILEDTDGVLRGPSNTVNLRSHLDDLQARLDSAMESYLVLAAAARPKGVGTFAAASRELSEKAAEASELLANLQRQSSDLDQKAEALDAQAAAVAGTYSEAQRLAEEIEKARRTAEENEQKILTASVAAEEARSKAASVDGQVQAYEDQFKALQEALDARQQAIKKGQDSLEKVRTAIVEKDKEVAAVLEQAKTMLGGATIAGLSTAYHNKAKAVNTQLMFARFAFYGAMLILLVSVLVALNLSDLSGLITGKLPAMPTLTAGADAGTLAVQTLAGLGSRAFVVLPALLLAGFAAHRHSALFRLREEYSHKEAMAVSVQGFKEQAPKYQEPIAAAVFQELLSNPAQSMDGSTKGRARNGFVQRLIAPAVEDTVKKLLELRDGAVRP